MPRSLVSRSLEPLVAVLWGVFLLWTAWLAVVWIVPVGSGELGFVAGSPPPPNPELRRAILLLAENADTVWLALAVMNLHRVLTHGYGLRVTRAWLLLSAGGGFALGVLNVKTGVLFGKMQFGAGLGKQLFGVALGWVLLWPALVLGAREPRVCGSIHGVARAAHGGKSGMACARASRLVGSSAGCARRALDEPGRVVRRSLADGVCDAGKRRRSRSRRAVGEAGDPARRTERDRDRRAAPADVVFVTGLFQTKARRVG
jgi:hypothetical protein